MKIHNFEVLRFEMGDLGIKCKIVHIKIKQKVK